PRHCAEDGSRGRGPSYGRARWPGRVGQAPRGGWGAAAAPNHSAWRLRPAEPADGPPGPSSDSGRWYTTLPSATVDASLDAAARSYSTVLVKKPTDSGYQSRLCLPDDAAITQTCWPHRRLG